jgi:hypothetical protein
MKHPPRPYNSLIANTLFRAGHIESWGRGIEKIERECRKHNIEPPDYNYQMSGLVLTFNYLKGVHQKILEIIADPEDWLDSWNLLEDNDPEVLRSALIAFAGEILQLLQKPMNQRGPVDW